MIFTLNTVQIQEPKGVKSLYQTEVRNERYFGIVRRKLARVVGIGQVEFIEKKAIDLIEAHRLKYKVNAQVLFEIKNDYNKALYSGFIDFATLVRTEQGYSCSFRDGGAVNAFDNNIDTVYSLTPNKQITLKKQDIFGTVSHEIDSALAVIFGKEEFAIPFKVKNKESVGEGLGLSVLNPFGKSPVYINSTTQKKNINVSGQLVFDASSSSANTFNVALVVISADGAVVKDLHLVSFNTTSSTASKNVIFNQAITIDTNESISIMIHSVNGSFDFNFKSDSFLSIEEDIYEASSQCWAISIYDAISQICTKNSVIFEIDIEILKSLYLTTGKNIRDGKNNINASFGYIFDDLKKIFCLSCNSADDKIKISYIKDLPKGYVQFVDRSCIASIEYSFANNYVYNTIKAGYNTWQSGTQLGNNETNTQAEYATGYDQVKSNLDLICNKLSASSKLIEYIRRMQYKQDKSSTTTDDKFDDQLFLIDIDSDSNETLTPKNILENWQFFLGYSESIDYLSSVGGYELVSGYEQIKFDVSGITGEEVAIELNKDFVTYDQIYNVFSWMEGGNTKKALLLRKEYRMANNTFLFGLVLE